MHQALKTHPNPSQGAFPGRSVAACFAMIAFSVAVLAGLAAGNDPSMVLIRSLVIMVVCYPIGLLVSFLVNVVVGGELEERTGGMDQGVGESPEDGSPEAAPST